MHLGILVAGPMLDSQAKQYGDYSTLFQRLLDPFIPALTVHAYSVYKDELPSSPEVHDAWLISGSRYTAFDREPWMLRLEVFIRAVHHSHHHTAQRRMIGICFGHQIMAQALGGRIARNPGGWGLGQHVHQLIDARPAWMQDDGDAHYAVSVIHEDQVVESPESAQRLASSDFCTSAILQYGDWALSFQGHPEFDNAFVHTVVDARENEVFSPADASQARKSLRHQEPQQQRAAQWIARFLQH